MKKHNNEILNRFRVISHFAFLAPKERKNYCKRTIAHRDTTMVSKCSARRLLSKNTKKFNNMFIKFKLEPIDCFKRSKQKIRKRTHFLQFFCPNLVPKYSFRLLDIENEKTQ